jgi:all-trans-retinol 13,14-reductase
MKSYDVLIIGSGMGGLVCGDILSREGYRVCILEKNKQIGGCLQIFTRNRVVFDSGVHYLGGLEPGQNLYQIFKYLGLMERLKLEKMDESFDRILLEGDPKEYRLAQGYERFVANLLHDFPLEEAGIRQYCDKIREVCDRFPMYRLHTNGDLEEKKQVWDISAKDYIASVSSDQTLRAVLGGNNMLYAGSGERTPFYVHALILNSYIESAWRCVDGGSQIARGMAANIRSRGGELLTRKEVSRIVVEGDRVSGVELSDGTAFRAGLFISNMSPSKTFRITETGLIRRATRERLDGLRNTVSSFILNLVFKKNSFPYLKHNYYYHKPGSLWNMDEYTPADWPRGYAILMAPSAHTGEFAEGMTIFTYMRYEEMLPWASTFNTVLNQGGRGEAYDQFKEAKAARLLDCVEGRFPGLRNCIAHYYTSTPLSYRDYIGNEDGSLYGAAKDFRDPYSTMMETRTRLPNLYLTGQQLNLHGVLGTAISGLITSAAIIGNEGFIEKIRNA